MPVCEKLAEEDMPSAQNVDLGFVDADGMRTSPPVKKMRGAMKAERLIASGLANVPGAPLEPATPAKVPTAEAPVEPCLAIVVYEPSDIQASESTGVNGYSGVAGYLPKPFAVRDCPPGMRIRGLRTMPPFRRAAPKPVVRKKTEKRKVEPANVTILSDSEPDEKDCGSSHQAAGPSKKKAGSAPRLKKRKAQELDDALVRFRPTADELKISANPRTRVKYIISQFDNLRRYFLAEEQQRVKENGSGSKRADLKASSAIIDSGCRVNGSESIYGDVPGVEVGDFYYYRMELLLVSLHRQSQAGIDFIPERKSEFRDKSCKAMSVAVSVIASGGYEDDKDEGDTLIYTGQGGNNYKGNRRQGLDQELLRGNLAMKNSCELGLAVRVIRGCDFKKSPVNQSPSGRIYYYDGLYDVVDCYQEKGTAGFRVWKFKLVRKAGQKPLSSRLVIFKGGKSLPNVLKERGERIIADDLSNGQEAPFKVRVVGCGNEDTVPNFEYITKLRHSAGVPERIPSQPCVCSTQCYRRNGCRCISLNGDQPYNDEGGLLRAKKLVYECGPDCRCLAAGNCTNRVSQNGLRYDMEVFKTKGKGWGVRSSHFIPQGSFVCEYIGEVIHETDAEKRVSDDEYMFDLKIPDSMERRFGQISGAVQRNIRSDEEGEDDANCQKYTVDANRFGNLARFINHSCEPNLFVQCVLYDHHDHRFPHIMLFASEHISPYKELTYDYGYELNKVIGEDGKPKKKNCYCGARTCRGRLY